MWDFMNLGWVVDSVWMVFSVICDLVFDLFEIYFIKWYVFDWESLFFIRVVWVNVGYKFWMYYGFKGFWVVDVVYILYIRVIIRFYVVVGDNCKE